MNHFREALKPVVIHGHKGRPEEECHLFFPALLAGFGTLLGCFFKRTSWTPASLFNLSINEGYQICLALLLYFLFWLSRFFIFSLEWPDEMFQVASLFKFICTCIYTHT